MENVTAAINYINEENARLADAINTDFDGQLTPSDVAAFELAMSYMDKIKSILQK